jgi:hypothetical protein
MLLGAALGAHLGLDAVQLQPPLDPVCLILRTLVVFEDRRLPIYRPLQSSEIPPGQPVLLGQAGVHKAGRNGDGRRRLERCGKPQDGAAVEVECECCIGPADDRSIRLAHEADVAWGAVDLNTLPWCRGPWMRASQQAKRTRRFRSLALPRQPDLIAITHASLDGSIRGRRQTGGSATAVHLFVQAGERWPARFGIMLFDRMREDRLDGRAQAFRPRAAASCQKCRDFKPAGLPIP